MLESILGWALIALVIGIVVWRGNMKVAREHQEFEQRIQDGKEVQCHIVETIGEISELSESKALILIASHLGDERTRQHEIELELSKSHESARMYHWALCNTAGVLSRGRRGRSQLAKFIREQGRHEESTDGVGFLGTTLASGDTGFHVRNGKIRGWRNVPVGKSVAEIILLSIPDRKIRDRMIRDRIETERGRAEVAPACGATDSSRSANAVATPRPASTGASKLIAADDGVARRFLLPSKVLSHRVGTGSPVYDEEWVSLDHEGRGISHYQDGSYRFWNLETLAPAFVLPGSEKLRFWAEVTRSHGLLMLRSQRGAVTYGSEEHLVVWSCTRRTEARRLRGHSERVSCAVEITGGRVASGSEDGTVRVWDLNNGKTTQVLEVEKDGQVDEIVLMPDNEHIASISTNDKAATTIWLWNLANGEAVQSVCAPTSGVRVFRPVGSGRRAVVMTPFDVAVVDLHTGEVVGPFDPLDVDSHMRAARERRGPQVTESYKGLVVHADGSRALLGMKIGNLSVVNLASGEILASEERLNQIDLLAARPESDDVCFVSRCTSIGLFTPHVVFGGVWPTVT